MDPDSIIDIIGLPLAHVGLRGEDGARCQGFHTATRRH